MKILPVPAGQVVPGKERDDGQPLDGHGQMVADHLAQLVGLALQAQHDALDLLVVLELGLEQPDHLHRRTSGPGDGHGRVAVGGKDLLHGPVGNGVSLGGPTIARHDHAVGKTECSHRRAVADVTQAGGGQGRAEGRPGARGHGRTPSGSIGALHATDQSCEVGARVIGRGVERQGHVGYSPPFWT